MSSDHGEEAVGPLPEDFDAADFDPDAEMAALVAAEAAESGDGEAFQRFDCRQPDDPGVATAIDAARRAVERGDLVVLPTDTVYGVAADAFSPDAVQRLLDAKNRGRDMPPPVLIADVKLMRVLAVDVPEDAARLAERHWPGPLTIICRAQPSLRLDLGETDGTIALRVPDHELARTLLRQIGPLAVSSANLSGQPAAVTCDEALAQLGDRVAVYLDGGRTGQASAEFPAPAAAPTASTIVDFTQADTGEVLRHGALSLEQLRETCPQLADPAETVEAEPPVAPSDPPAA